MEEAMYLYIYFFQPKRAKKKRLLNERRWPEMLNVEVFEVQPC
jgi:hypothetical protein